MRALSRFLRWRPPADSGPEARVMLIVGLGNPGRTYSGNRHNVGFMCVDHFARTHSMRFTRKAGNARVAEGRLGSLRIVLARPQTFMNDSGRAVSALLRRLRLAPEDLVVVQDDLDLPLGRIRVRRGGTSGGHKGIESIIGSVGSRDFVRVRIGIGRPGRAEAPEQRRRDVVDHVLGDMTSEEHAQIESTVKRAAAALESLVEHGLVATMNTFNAAKNGP